MKTNISVSIFGFSENILSTFQRKKLDLRWEKLDPMLIYFHINKIENIFNISLILKIAYFKP